MECWRYFVSSCSFKRRFYRRWFGAAGFYKTYEDRKVTWLFRKDVHISAWERNNRELFFIFLGSLDVLHQSIKRKKQFFIVIAEALLFDCRLCFSLIDVLENELGWMRHQAYYQSFNKCPAWKKGEKLVNACLDSHGVRLVKRKIIYVRDWSVRSDPIICWDVNYTVLSVHVKRQIIEEGKRWATFYLCCRSEPLRASLFCFFLSAVFLPASQNVGCVTPAELIIWQIYRFHWSVMSASLDLCACACAGHLRDSRFKLKLTY